MKVIYDFGANNGDDLPYYLTKADLVVAVEANPVLCGQMRERFREEIAAGGLVVEDKVLAAGNAPPEVHFYVHKTDHVLSQFPAPDDLDNFEKLLLPSCSPLDLINRYGEPHYIKIDIEHYDAQILRELFGGGVRPPFISAEAHTVEVFAILMGLGGYQAFKLVDGRSVPVVYGNAIIEGPDGPVRFSFARHTAGPFGDDILGPWLDGSALMKMLVIEGFGWKDIHASLVRKPEGAGPNTVELVRGLLRKAGTDFKRKLFFVSDRG